jgi:hypothetical protein
MVGVSITFRGNKYGVGLRSCNVKSYNATTALIISAKRSTVEAAEDCLYLFGIGLTVSFTGFNPPNNYDTTTISHGGLAFATHPQQSLDSE